MYYSTWWKMCIWDLHYAVGLILLETKKGVLSVNHVFTFFFSFWTENNKINQVFKVSLNPRLSSIITLLLFPKPIDNKMSSYVAHSDLPQPAIFNHVKPHHDERVTILGPFLDRYASTAIKLTIDDDNVGRGLVCAFTSDSSKVEGVMLYLKKPEIQSYLEKQGYKCTLSPASTVIQCVKTNKSLSSLSKL